MARIRTIKPEFFRHEELQDLEIANPGKYVMLVFAGIWGHCDSKGRFEYRPRQLKLDVLPFLPFDMAESLQLLVDAGLIRRYSVDGKKYGFIPSFEKHQRVSGKEATEGEKHPGIESADNEDEWKQRGSNGEATGKQRGSARDEQESQEQERSTGTGKGMEQEQEGSVRETISDQTPQSTDAKPQAARASRSLDYSPEFEEFWTQYPKRHGADSKQAGWRCWQSRIRDGCGPGTMILGAQRYAAYCDAKVITGTEYVMQASRFLGRDRYFENDWRKPNATGYVFDPNDRPF